MPTTHTCFLTLAILLANCLDAQTISRFTWDNSLDPTVADFGPNAASINAFATVKERTDNNTRGLAPGADPNKADLDLVLTDDPAFDVPGIDLSYDFLRNENTGTILRRGDFFFGRASEIVVNYAVDDGAGSFTTILSATEPVPNDGAYHNLRFRYDPGAGNAELFLDGTLVWTNPTKTPGQPLYWEGAGDLVIGIQIDATGSGNAVLDNFDFQRVEATALPVTFGEFRARSTGAGVELEWATHSEEGNDYFDVQRRSPEDDWEAIGRVPGAGDSQTERRYDFTDPLPPAGPSVYRLRQVDFDGSAAYSALRSVYVADGEGVEVFPTLVSDGLTVRATALKDPLVVYDPAGRELLRFPAERGKGSGPAQQRIDLGGLPAGLYYLRVGPRYGPIPFRKR